MSNSELNQKTVGQLELFSEHTLRYKVDDLSERNASRISVQWILLPPYILHGY